MNETNPNCIICGKPLTGQQRKYCSSTCCKRALWIAKSKLLPKRYCLICGKELDPRKRVYCSDRCAKLSIKLRDEEKRKAIEDEAEFMDNYINKRNASIKRRREVTMSFDEALAKAEEMGLSYGEFVARYDK